MDKKHLTEDDIKEAFSNFAEGLRTENPDHQLASAGMMLNLMSDYLHQNVDGIDTTAILILLEELHNISNGNEARFIKSKFEGGGRPIDAGKNTKQAALCAAIQVLVNNDTKVKDAIALVSQWSGELEKKLQTLRSDFNKNNKSRDATDLMWQLVQRQKEENLEPNRHAKSLVEIAMKIGE